MSVPVPATVASPATAQDLGRPRTLWALGAVMGQVDALRRAHLHLAEVIDVGDRLLYLGNLLGPGGQTRAVLEEVAQFRRAVLSLPCVIESDVVVLRGPQEEMMERLLWLPYAADPAAVLSFYAEQGGAEVLGSLGTSLEAGHAAARRGAAALADWVREVRQALGPTAQRVLTSARHSAWLARGSGRRGLAFVAAGYASARPPWQQSEAAWWHASGFVALTTAPDPVDQVVRGYDPEDCGLEILDHRISLDGGSGRGGDLHLARFGADGSLRQLLDFR